jgi:hypothetical protein
MKNRKAAVYSFALLHLYLGAVRKILLWQSVYWSCRQWAGFQHKVGALSSLVQTGTAGADHDLAVDWGHGAAHSGHPFGSGVGSHPAHPHRLYGVAWERMSDFNKSAHKQPLMTINLLPQSVLFFHR